MTTDARSHADAMVRTAAQLQQHATALGPLMRQFNTSWQSLRASLDRDMRRQIEILGAGDLRAIDAMLESVHDTARIHPVVDLPALLRSVSLQC